MRIAYLANQYPSVSHSFIRREILALEGQGLEVTRIALREWNGQLLDAENQVERERTRYVLGEGAPALLAALVRAPRSATLVDTASAPPSALSEIEPLPTANPVATTAIDDSVSVVLSAARGARRAFEARCFGAWDGYDDTTWGRPFAD